MPQPLQKSKGNMYNRGVKRDSFGNRNFNNRGMGGSGGGGGGSGGGRSGNMGGGMGGGMGGMGGGSMGSGVNPWEGGMMPGRGILPTPNNNLSLASSQAQLAIASNLLSNILRTQQETQPQVPSLLSLGNNYSGPGSNYGNQQNYQGRYNDRPSRQNLKSQRAQPYNKMGNRARDGAAGRRGPSAQHSRASGNQRVNGSQIQHRNDKSSKASKQNQSAKKEQMGDKSNKASDKTKEKAETSVVESKENDSTEDKKCDGTEEEKEGDADVKIEEGEDKESDAQEGTKEDKEGESKDGEKKDSEEDKKDTSGKPPVKKSEARHAESRYADVPMNHMFCHVCNKHMWDGSSFENHLRGRAHKLMMEKLDESYKLKVDLMRHDLRVTEEQRELSLTNSKRRGRKVGIDFSVREYCTMCDLNFYGTLSSHRKSEKHQQLKTFLHPRCTACAKEFPSRIEYDEHCLTPQHMKNSASNEEQRKGNKQKRDKLAKGESEVRTAEDEEKDIGTESKNEKPEETPDNVEYVTDIDDTTKDNIVNLKTPSYKYCRQKQVSVGKSMVTEVQGFYCEKCRRFMLLPEDMASHLRTITHYRNFIQEVKALTAAANAEAEKLKKEEAEAANDGVNEESEEYEGKAKRRKIEHSEDDENADKKESQVDGLTDEHDPQKEDGDDKYDPMDAENEDEEEENPPAEGAKETTEESQKGEIQNADTTKTKEDTVEKDEKDEIDEKDEKDEIDEKDDKDEKDEKNEKDDKVEWSDGENEFESEVGNLMDDSMDDKETTDHDTTNEKVETPKSAAAAAAKGRPSPRARGQRARRSRR